MEDVEAYFGKPLIEEKTDYDIVGVYKYKNSDLYVAFSYFLEGNHYISYVSKWNKKGKQIKN